MKAGMIARTIVLTVAIAASATAQSGGSSCSDCPKDDAAQRALIARTEKVRAEVDRLIKEAARQGSEADTVLVQLSEALARLKASERLLKASVEREARVYRQAPVAAQGAAYGYAANSQMPAGYMGISLSGTTEVKPGEELVVLYRDTPIIEAVEPGSPAERAGLESGDVILAYNGEELKGRSISLTKLLKPGARVMVRVRRQGTTKEIPVIVGSRTSFTTVRAPTVRATKIEPAPVVQPGFEFSFDSDTIKMRRAPSGVRTRSPEAVMLPPMLAGSGAAFAGAELTASNAGLGEYFGASRGIVVLHVAEGTPAHRAGILVGDVITRIGDDQVSRPAEFQRALATSTTRVLDIEVVRRGKKKDVVLKW